MHILENWHLGTKTSKWRKVDMIFEFSTLKNLQFDTFGKNFCNKKICHFLPFFTFLGIFSPEMHLAFVVSIYTYIQSALDFFFKVCICIQLSYVVLQPLAQQLHPPNSTSCPAQMKFRDTLIYIMPKWLSSKVQMCGEGA